MEHDKLNLNWDTVGKVAYDLSKRMAADLPEMRRIYGVPRGGCLAATLIAQHGYHSIVDTPEEADLIVDDIIDSGDTRDSYTAKTGKAFYALIDKTSGQFENCWVVFPWELGDEEQGAEDNVRRILQAIGEDPTREGLIETPKRFIKMLREMTSGYHETPSDHLKKSFDVKDADPEIGTYDELIMSGPLPFVSMCEHHMALFEGHAWIAYIPGQEGGRVVGLSKLARLLEGYARRLQVQERLTMQVINAMMKVLKPDGAAVMIRARHTCQCARGVKKDGRMVTSALRGFLKENDAARAEFLQLVRMSG